MSKNVVVRKQGTYETQFRKTVKHTEKITGTSASGYILGNHSVRMSFKNQMTKLFMKKHSDIKVIVNNKELKHLLVDKIWEEFYDIAINKDIECAIIIIFNRYDKQKTSKV
jgi:hypothetical protein